MVLGSSPVAVTSPSDFAPASSKEFLDIQATIECGFTLKRVRDMSMEEEHTVKDIMSLAVGTVGFLSCNKVVSKLIALMGFT